MSESIELRNKRTFGGLFELHSNQNLLCYFDLKLEGAKTFYNLYSAIFYAAAKLSISLVQRIAPLRDEWGMGDDTLAAKIFEICCYPLTSIASRDICKGKNWTAQQKAEVSRTRFEELFSIMDLEADLDDCINLDAQINYDLDKNSEDPEGLLIYSNLFYARILKLFHMPVSIDWSAISYPVKNEENLPFCGEPDEIKDISGLITDAGEIMMGTFAKFTRESSAGK